MKKLFMLSALSLVFTAAAAPVRVTGFESKDGRFNKTWTSGNAACEVVAVEGAPEGTHVLKIVFGGKKDLPPKMSHWGNIQFLLPVKKIPAGAKIIRFWVKGSPAKGYGVGVRLGKFIHRAPLSDKRAWIDFGDGDWFQYECALKDFIPAQKDAGNGAPKDFSGITFLIFSSIGDWRIKAADRKPQEFFIDLIEVE